MAVCAAEAVASPSFVLAGFDSGAKVGIVPVHLGIIFLANLELGYLTPPLGLNLFLASY